MPRKKRQKKSFSKGSKKQNRQGSPWESNNNHGDKILAFLHSQKDPVPLAEITNVLSGSKKDAKQVGNSLYDLIASGLVFKNNKKEFVLHSKAPFFTGRLEANAKGFGFVSDLTAVTTIEPPKKDAFVPKHRMVKARHGDKILIRLGREKQGWKREATIISVLERGSETVTGFYQPSSSRNIVKPEDHRFPFQIDIGESVPDGLSPGDAVVVQLGNVKEESSFIHGKINKILGSPESVDVQMQLVVEKFHLPSNFSDETQHELKSITDNISEAELQKRQDLREILHVTIDGETAKDFDDAISVLKTRTGFKLYVSIADVSHFVRPGSSVDKEAYERGTSIYFPGRVIPMLPEKLSNNLCSLIPDVDRLAFTAILDFDRQGNLQNKEFCKSVIKSHKRFTYNIVQQIIIDKDPNIRKLHKPFLTPLKWAKELAEQLQTRRTERGSIGFNIPEPFINLGEDGKITEITRSSRFFAHQLIEEFMLIANEAVAATFTETNTDSLYRIHEEPSQEKVEEFVTFAQSLGLQLPKSEVSPAWFAEILTNIKGSPKEYVFNNLLLRTMQQARYSCDNKGHFGLAATDYTHFTSPIRRYPDLHVHRTLMQLLEQSKVGKKVKTQPKEQLKDVGIFLSARERTAIDAERDIHNRLKIFFMEKFIGDSFEAIISGVTASALFIEVIEPFVNGAIPIEELKDDYYLHDPKRHHLIGDTSLKTYQIGDIIQVKLVSVDKTRYRLNFTLSN